MHRRALLHGAATVLLVASLSARAQPPGRRFRIGVLAIGTPEGAVSVTDAFKEALRDLGYIEGGNVIVVGNNPAIVAAKQATSTIPIVMVIAVEPVRHGFIASLARPGGNITGVTNDLGPGIQGKSLGLLKEMVPGLATVAVLAQQDIGKDMANVEAAARRLGLELDALAHRLPGMLQALKEIVPAARRFAILINPNAASRARIEENLPPLEKALDASVRVHEARGPHEYEGVFAAIARDRVDGIVILSDPTTFANRTKLQELCVAHRLPSAWGGRGYLEPGGLVSFQSDFAAAFRRAAALVDKILKGTKPGDIPFELPTKFELIVNLKAAKSLGLTIPQAVLLRADEVIE